MSFLDRLISSVNPIRGINSIIGAAGDAGAKITGQIQPGALSGLFGGGAVPFGSYLGGSSGQPFFGGGAQVDFGSPDSWWKRYGLWIIAGGVLIIGITLMFIFWPFSGPRSVKATSVSRSSSRSRSATRSKSTSRSKSKGGPLKKGSPEAKARMAELRSMVGKKKRK